MNWRIHNGSEFEPLKHVVVCPPTFMEIAEVINEVQKKYINEGIHQERAITQHQQFIKQLQDYQVFVSELEATEDLPEQVFTRDIGFTIGDTVFVSNLACAIRQNEVGVWKEWLNKQHIPFQTITEGTIEGGDVVVNGKDVYIGLTKRTNQEAFHCLKKQLPKHHLHALPLREDILHLDCVFMPIAKDAALWLPDAFSKNDQAFLQSQFELIAITEQEQVTMGCNILVVQNKTIFSMPQQTRINHLLRARGFHVVVIPFDEITKSGGSFRCCSLPLLRKSVPNHKSIEGELL